MKAILLKLKGVRKKEANTLHCLHISQHFPTHLGAKAESTKKKRA